MRRASDILKVFIDQATAEKADLYHGFFSGWAQVAGERIAAHSQIKDIDNGIVIVEVDHPGWIQMIQLNQSRFVEVLRKRYPDLEIRGMRLQLPWSRPRPVGGDPAARLMAADSGDADSQQGGPERHEGDEASEPADPQIRGALERLGRAIEERKEP